MAKSARKHRADDCMDAGGRATQDAKAENRSVYRIHEDLLQTSCLSPFGSAELFKIIPNDFVSTELTTQLRKKAINRASR